MKARNPWADRWPLVVAALCAAVMIWAAIPDPEPPKAPVPETSELVGRWIRHDGTYSLEITSVREDGAVRAGYFNPEPINVESANAERTEDALTLMIVLRDEEKNYRGSTYRLVLNPETGRLEGNYYEATGGQTSQVAFAREEPAADPEPPPGGNP